LLSFSVPLSAQTNWSGINVKPSPIPVLTATNGELGVNTFENYTIPYKLRGTLSLATAIPLMTTADGRRFLLVGPRADGLTALDGKKIYVEGKVKELDDRDELLVTRIDLSSRVPFESRKILPWQKRAYLINKDGATYTVGNMAWDAALDARGKVKILSDGSPVFIFKKAVIHPDMVKDIYFVKKAELKDNGKLGMGDHCLLFLTFRKGGVTAEDGTTTPVMCLSIDAERRFNGDSYTFKKAIAGVYRILYTLGTAKFYLEKKENLSAEPVRPYRLKLTRAQTVELTRKAIEQAVVNREGEYYDLFKNSCTNSLLVMINSVLNPSQRMHKSRILPSEKAFRLNITAPDAASSYLKRKGLIDNYIQIIGPNNYRKALTQPPWIF